MLDTNPSKEETQIVCLGLLRFTLKLSTLKIFTFNFKFLKVPEPGIEKFALQNTASTAGCRRMPTGMNYVFTNNFRELGF